MRRELIGAALVAVLATTSLALDPALKKKAKDPDSFKRSDAARELAREGSPEAAKLLIELMQDRNPYTRDHTVIACGRLERKKSIAVIARLAKSRDELPRRNVAEALGRTKSTDALPFLEKLALKDRSPLVRATALDGLWGYRNDPNAVVLAMKAFADDDPFVRAAAIEAAGRVRGEGVAELMEKGLADPDPGVRCVAQMELYWVDRERATARMPAAAADPEWTMRAQAVDDALNLRDGPSIDALVKLVGDERVRVAAAAHWALGALTGKEYGRDPQVWKDWWEANREGWKPPKGKLDADAKDDPKRTTATYHGVEITSQHVAFVLDVSGSMRLEVPGGKRTRWEHAKDELGKTLDALPDGTRVNVLLFQEDVSVAFPKASKLTAKNRKAIRAFLRRTNPGDAGDLLQGMLVALAQTDVDTIYLLSDGAPSAGEMVDKGRVRRAIRQVNRSLKRAIHTIGFGAQKKTERSFLAGVAKDAGSRVVFR